MFVFFRHNIFYIEKQKIYFTTYLIENLLTLLNIRITYRKDFAKNIGYEFFMIKEGSNMIANFNSQLEKHNQKELGLVE